MSEKIKSLSEHRNRKKPRSLEEIVETASRRFRDNVSDDLEEPEALASGDMQKILDGEDKDDEEKSGRDS